MIGVDVTDGDCDIMLFSAFGKVVRFYESPVIDAEGNAKGGVRGMGRTAAGVRGIKLAEGDKVISLIVPHNDGDVLTVTENGYGKRTELAEYPAKSRATQGVVSIKVSERNGRVVGAVQAEDGDEFMMITNAGTLVRTRVSEVSRVGRNTQGVTLIRTTEGEKVVGLQRIDEPEEELIEDAELVEGEAVENTDQPAIDTSSDDSTEQE